MVTSAQCLYALDVRTLFLPAQRGYGTLADLHIAMSRDSANDNVLAALSLVA